MRDDFDIDDDDDDFDRQDDDYDYNKVELNRPPFEILATENPVDSEGRFSEYGSSIIKQHFGVEMIVFHNTSYGCTGEMAIWGMGQWYEKRAPYGDAMLKLIRSVGGCGSSELSSMANFFGFSQSWKLSFLHLLLTKVMVEPGPKFVFGVSTRPDKKLDHGMMQLRKWQSPHDQWEDRRLGMYAWDHISLNKYMMGKTQLPFAKYLYVPTEWPWSDNSREYHARNFGRMHVKRDDMSCIAGDLVHIPYLQEFIKEKPFEKESDRVCEAKAESVGGGDQAVLGPAGVQLPAAAGPVGDLG